MHAIYLQTHLKSMSRNFPVAIFYHKILHIVINYYKDDKKEYSL